MNYLLPLKGIASMHCSANVGEKEDVAIFFGLSGTGKTTLSTDPKRRLIGDDEHGWDDDGVFNFEGGCYAKTIKLSEAAEPDIYHAIRRDALLENVVVLADGTIDFNDGSKTENTRVSYPINHIENIVKPISKAGHATKVIFLTADAFGVLPPVSRLTADQTQYHFLSGFTAKLAGTERGVTEPTPTFSACFGAAFLSLHPTQYAEVLVKRMQASGAQAYLVNTGWNGTGKRISIKDTRAIIDAILDGSLDNAETFTLPMFELQIPTELPGWIPISSTRATPTARQSSGRRKRSSWRSCLLRTSRSTPIRQRALRWWPQGRNANQVRRYEKAGNRFPAFFRLTSGRLLLTCRLTPLIQILNQLIHLLIGKHRLKRGGKLTTPVWILGAGPGNIDRLGHHQPILRLQAQQRAVAVGDIALHPTIQGRRHRHQRRFMPGTLRQTAVAVQSIQQPLLRQLAILIQSAQYHLIRIQAERFTQRQVAAFPVAAQCWQVMRRSHSH